ncbi:MAG: PepSY domain-containing protein [Halomonadaceae bacterium]|nr:MAG: PepSY domain-containing protein [Halomonadaceae bacterium]
MSFRRTLYLWHRYLGIALCLLIAMWFASGIVLMYVGYPSLDNDRRLEGLPALQTAGLMAPAEVMAAYPGAERLRLNAAPGYPVYHVQSGGRRTLVDARSGLLLQPDRQQVMAAAQHHSGSGVAEIERIRVDQWSVHGRFDGHRPLYRARMEDPQGTWLYLSSVTGEVVQAATRFERGWNWVGAVPHWIYPWQLRQHPELWRQVVIWLSVPALALIISGTVVGVWRLRVRRRYKGNRLSPYRGWQHWHHLLGLASAVFVFTFMVSGLFSMNPGRVFTSPAPDIAYQTTWADGSLEEATVAPLSVLPLNGARELEWRRDAGQTLVLLHSPGETRTLLASGEPVAFTEAELKQRAQRLVPNADLMETTSLENYDAYYYARHRPRPLPVLRLNFDDPGNTTLYINPANGALESRVDRRGRWRRWLYNGLHSLDMAFLWQRRPLWDLVVLSLMVTGLAFSLTGVVMGWKRLTFRSRRRRRR